MLIDACWPVPDDCRSFFVVRNQDDRVKKIALFMDRSRK
jgi:hypothetical protein